MHAHKTRTHTRQTPMKLINKRILIVGASSGIGRAVALQLAKRNNQLILSARRETELKQLAREVEACGSQAVVIAADALDADAAQQTVDKAIDACGAIDVALLNVGDGPSFHMATVSAADIRHNMDLNYATLVNFLTPLIAHMKQRQQGLIAHTNSLAGFLGLPMQGPYSAAKAAGRILMDTCRLELKNDNIRFVSLYPGFVATERVADDGIPAPMEISEQQAANHMIKGMERGRSDYLFPASTKWLIRLALLLPKRLTGWLLLKAIPEHY